MNKEKKKKNEIIEIKTVKNKPSRSLEKHQ